MKFASSAAHLSAAPLISARYGADPGKPFPTAPAEARHAMARLFTSGVNHLFLQGLNCTSRPRPFGLESSLGPHLPELNQWITRCQSVLQAAHPANDILLYFPIHDIWHTPAGKGLSASHLTHENAEEWLYTRIEPFHDTARQLIEKGYTFDYISDHLIHSRLSWAYNTLMGGPNSYRAILVPQCRFLPLHTFQRLKGLANQGATIIFIGHLPQDTPGYANITNRRINYRDALKYLPEPVKNSDGTQQIDLGKGRFLISPNLTAALDNAGIDRETMADHGIRFTRRARTTGMDYLLFNPGTTPADTLPISVPAKAAAIFDPATGAIQSTPVRKTISGVHAALHILPGQTLILRTFDEKPEGINTLPPFQAATATVPFTPCPASGYCQCLLPGCAGHTSFTARLRYACLPEPCGGVTDSRLLICNRPLHNLSRSCMRTPGLLSCPMGRLPPYRY
jgi:hypothetical protein